MIEMHTGLIYWVIVLQFSEDVNKQTILQQRVGINIYVCILQGKRDSDVWN